MKHVSFVLMMLIAVTGTAAGTYQPLDVVRSIIGDINGL